MREREVLHLHLTDKRVILKENGFSFMSKYHHEFLYNKAGYTATPVTVGWAGALFEVSLSFRQEQ